MKAEGKVIRYGDNIDTDVIIPARYLNTTSHTELAQHCMEDIDPDFLKKMSPGDIMVGGKNFGCGSALCAVTIIVDIRALNPARKVFGSGVGVNRQMKIIIPRI